VNPSSIRIVRHGRIIDPSSTLIPIAIMNCWKPEARLILILLPDTTKPILISCFPLSWWLWWCRRRSRSLDWLV
jgi:hypothetical protein